MCAVGKCIISMSQNNKATTNSPWYNKFHFGKHEYTSHTMEIFIEWNLGSERARRQNVVVFNDLWHPVWCFCVCWQKAQLTDSTHTHTHEHSLVHTAMIFSNERNGHFSRFVRTNKFVDMERFSVNGAAFNLCVCLCIVQRTEWFSDQAFIHLILSFSLVSLFSVLCLFSSVRNDVGCLRPIILRPLFFLSKPKRDRFAIFEWLKCGWYVAGSFTYTLIENSLAEIKWSAQMRIELQRNCS